MVKPFCKILPILFFAFVLFGLAQRAEAATIRVEIDRNPVLMDESFTLVFEAEGSVDEDPDFSALERVFDILRQSEGSSMQIINGEVSQKKQWTLSLMPREPGRFIIPPIPFGKDSSESIMIDIKAAAVLPDGNFEPIFFEVSVEPTTTYVQSQVIYTARLYRSVTLISGNLSEPTLSDADAVIEKLGNDRSFETILNGQRYLVVERVYAIFPQQSGQLTLLPLKFEGQIATQSRSRFSPFNQGGPIKRIHSKTIVLDVKPVPKDKITGRWLPARDLRLIEKLQDASEGTQQIKAGEPLTRTLMLVAEGLTAAQLPEINMNLPDGFKSYPDQPLLEDKIRSDGIIGIRQEKIALIPMQGGSYRLPAIEIPWWNTLTQQPEVARLEERLIEVAPAERVEVALPSGSLQQEGDLLGEGAGASVSEESQKGASFWSLISLVLGLGWVFTLVAWWGSRQKQGGQNATTQSEIAVPDTGPIKRQLKKACMQNEAEVAKEALLAWSRVFWPQRSHSLGEVRNRVEDTLGDEIQKLNAVLYSQESGAWQGGPALWAAFEQEVKKEKKKAVRKPEGLVPMVP